MRAQGKQRGFTLIEIVAAFMILTIGVGSVLGVLTGTVTRERAAVMRSRIIEALPFVEEAVGEIVTTPGELVDREERAPVPGFPELSWRVTFEDLQEWQDEVLARIAITWQQGGEAQEEFFLLVCSRHQPFEVRSRRVHFRPEDE